MPRNNMAKKMLIDATHPEETRVVVVDGNKVEDFDFESINKRQLAGNIYLAKVTRVEPSLQAAFVEYGGNRHGFLAFSEIHPDYYQIPIADREALLAEEEREEQERKAREESEDEKPKRGRKRGGRNRKSRDRDQDQDQTDGETTGADDATPAAAVAGLEVIDVASDAADAMGMEVDGEAVPAGLEIAEPDAQAPEFGAKAEAADVSAEAGDAAEAEAAPAEDNADPTPEAEASAPADDTADTSSSEEPAEAAPDAESPVAEADQADSEAAESKTEAEAEAPVEETEAEAPVEEAAPEEAPVEDASADEAPVASDAGDAEATQADAPDAEPQDAPEADTDGTPPRSMAESAGLDTERVTEEIDGPDRKPDEEASSDAEQAADEGQEPETPKADTAASENSVSEASAPAEEAASETTPEVAEEAPEAEAEAASTDEADAVEATATAEEAPSEETASEADAPAEASDADTAEAPATSETNAAETAETAPEESTPGEDEEAATDETTPEEASTDETSDGDGADEDGSDDDEDRPRKSRRRRRSRRNRNRSDADNEDDTSEDSSNDDSSDDDNSDDDDDDDDIDEVGAEDVQEEVAATRTRLRRKYKIQDVIRVRQILLVQVVKEERGNKGAALTTYLSLAGRYCVLMPNTARGGGISRKIVNAQDRKRLREITNELEVPKGMGLIVRTAGAERTRPEIKRDYEFLTRQWEQIRELTLKSVAPTLIYEEGSLIKRSIRDIYSKEIDQILVEGDESYREAKEYMKMLMPSHAKNVQPYSDPIPLFSRYQVESYLNGMFNPTVQLKSGGYIVIGVTEALVAIDVNSGRATKQGSIEETAVQTNLEAADEVARQLRLRDLAGLIVIDFIDMDENRNNRAVEKRMKDRLKNDRARIQVGRISGFGLMEMSRQRLRPGMLEATTQPCPHCLGTGLIRSDENLTLSILREIEEEGVRSRANQITIKVPVAIANYLINQKRETLALIEARHGVSVAITADPLLTSPNYEIERSRTTSPRPERQASSVVTSSSVVSDTELVEDAEIVETREDRDEEENRNRKRRGKRGGRRRRGEDRNDDPNRADEAEDTGEDQPSENAETGGDDDSGDSERKRSRRGGRRRRGGRNRKGDENGQNANGMEVIDPEGEQSESADATEATEVVSEATAEAAEPAAAVESDAAEHAEAGDQQPGPEKAEAAPEAPAEAAPETAVDETAADETPSEEAPVADAQVAEATADAEATEPDAPTEEAEPEPELVAAEPEPESPPKPKRRGWWSFGR